MRKALALLLILLTCSWLVLSDSTKDCTDCDPVYSAYPRIEEGTVLISGSVPILVNRTYVVGYGEARMNPLWVCYRVYDVAQVGTAPGFGWRIDSRTESRVSDGDYTHTGYDRGHMAPRSSMYHCYGEPASRDTYWLTNACPQLHPLNDGPWGDLEDLVRENYSITCDEVWVIAGPIFDDSNGQAYLTKDAAHCGTPQKPIEIPDAFYKIVIDEQDGEIRALAFIMEHSEGYGYGQGHSVVERLSSYLVDIDEIEDRTGLDFFSDLDDEEEEELESDEEPTMW